MQSVQLYSSLGERGFADLSIPPDQKFYLAPDAGIKFFFRDLKGLPLICDSEHHFLTGGHLLLPQERWSALSPVCSYSESGKGREGLAFQFYKMLAT